MREKGIEQLESLMLLIMGFVKEKNKAVQTYEKENIN